MRRNKSELPESQDIQKDEDGEEASTHTPLPPPIPLAGVGSLGGGEEESSICLAYRGDSRTCPDCACSSESKGHCVFGAEVQTEEWEA